jgi:hypothetical protein
MDEGGEGRKEFPECICIVTGSLALSLSMLLQGCFPVKTRSWGLSCQNIHPISQISDFSIGEIEGGGGVSTRRRVSHSTPSLMQRKHFVSVCCNTNTEYAQTDRCMLL